MTWIKSKCYITDLLLFNSLLFIKTKFLNKAVQPSDEWQPTFGRKWIFGRWLPKRKYPNDVFHLSVNKREFDFQPIGFYILHSMCWLLDKVIFYSEKKTV